MQVLSAYIAIVPTPKKPARIKPVVYSTSWVKKMTENMSSVVKQLMYVSK